MSDLVFRESSDSNERNVLVCPFCEHSYVRVGKPIHFSGDDDYRAARVFGMGVRGDVMGIPFHGECGLAFGFHKGMTFYEIIRKGRG